MNFLDTGWVKVRRDEIPAKFEEAWTRRGWVIGIDPDGNFTVINRSGEVLAKLRSINLDSAKGFANDRLGSPMPKKSDLDWWRLRQSHE